MFTAACFCTTEDPLCLHLFVEYVREFINQFQDAYFSPVLCFQWQHIMFYLRIYTYLDAFVSLLLSSKIYFNIFRKHHGDAYFAPFLFSVPGYEGIAPKFLAKPVIRQAGSGVVFEVRLTADPGPAITWYKGSTVIGQGGRYNLVTQTDGANYTLHLEISNITPDDGGTYKVTAKNKHGESNANLNLNLEGECKTRNKHANLTLTSN